MIFVFPVFVGPKSISCFTEFVTNITIVSWTFDMSSFYVLHNICFPFWGFSTVKTHPTGVWSFVYLWINQIFQIWKSQLLILGYGSMFSGNVHFQGLPSGAECRAVFTLDSVGRKVFGFYVVANSWLVFRFKITMGAAPKHAVKSDHGVPYHVVQRCRRIC